MRVVKINRFALQDWREERGLSLSALARDAGITPSFLCDIEKGRKQPSPATLNAIAGALKVRRGTLLLDPNLEDAA